MKEEVNSYLDPVSQGGSEASQDDVPELRKWLPDPECCGAEEKLSLHKRKKVF